MAQQSHYHMGIPLVYISSVLSDIFYQQKYHELFMHMFCEFFFYENDETDRYEPIIEIMKT